MRKKLIIFIILSMFFLPNIVLGAGAKIQIDAPSTVYIGDTVKVNVTISSSSSIGSWEYTVGYDDSKLSLSSSTAETSQKVTNYATSGGKTSVTYSWTFNAKSAGSATFNIPSIVVYSFDDESEMSISGSKSKTITIKNPSPINGGGGSSNTTPQNRPTYNYSSNNYLSSLTIEGHELSFDKNVTNYALTVSNDTKKINVGATAEDSKARVSGIGEFELVEGINKLDVIVTAENGDTKTYTINVDVLELSPIEVEVNGNKYFVVRKSEQLPMASLNYVLDKVLVKGEEVPCYYSETSGIYLVGLKDDGGNITLFNYDNVNDKFLTYQELSFGNIYLSILEPDFVLKGYTRSSIKINDQEVSIYTKDNNYPLLYGKNIETGEVSYYSYDEHENTIQRFELKQTTNNVNYSTYVIIGLIGLVVIQFIIMISIVVSKNKKLKKQLVDKLSTKTGYEENLDNNDNNSNNEDNLENNFEMFKSKEDIKKKKKKKHKETDDEMYKF
ncbi:MAG: cadherin-like beta sandwich domain-containing protein [Bacilli bacterium]|nr:cadherin-like beta sandwich domain-containing protein [Bacilli bacterium]